jgi:hypothetical protein
MTNANAIATKDTETENIIAAAKEDSFDKILKFRKGEYFIGEDQVPLGTEYLVHCIAWTKCWIKFEDKRLVERKLYRVARGERPLDRNDLDEIEKAETENDPWSLQYMLPFEHMVIGEVVIFTTSSIGGRRAIGGLCDTYAKRKRKGEDGQPIIKLAVGEMNTKDYGKVPCPVFAIVGWDDGHDVSDMSDMADPVGKVSSKDDMRRFHFR